MLRIPLPSLSVATLRRPRVRRLRSLLVAGLLASVAPVSAQPLPDGPRLRDLAGPRGLLVGAALGDNFTSAGMGAATYAAYTTVAAREFNFFTAENAHKFGRLHPTDTPPAYTFTAADRYDTFARQAGGHFHGHVFIWYKDTSIPDFVVNTTTRDGLLAILNDHIDTVGARYGPGTVVWDVVNEALQNSVAATPSNWRDALRHPSTDHWHNIIGDDYIELAFRRAAAVRAARGHTYRLVYNDYGNESLSPKADAQYLMAQDFLARGVPLEGLGFQFHIGTATPSYANIRANFKRLSDLGLDLYITEFDTITGSGATDLDKQAALYHRVLDIALRNPHFRGFQTWGFTDRTSWLYTWSGNPLGDDVRPLPFTADFAAKPAYYAIQDALAYEHRAPLVQNGGFENQLAPWSPSAGSVPAATFALSAAAPHSGAHALLVSNRVAATTGPVQDVYPVLASSRGGTGFHHLAGWFRVPSGPTPVRLVLRVTDSTGATRDFPVEGVAGASWTRLSGRVNVTWNRALVAATIFADTPGSTADFLLDDVTLGDGNLLANSTMEDGVDGWTALGSPVLSEETTQARRHYGDRGLRASARASAWNGPMQDIRPALLAAGPGLYEVSGYMKTTVAGRVGKLTVRLGVGGAYLHHSVAREIGADSWTRVSGRIELAWDAPPATAILYAETTAGAEALDLDDVLLRKLADPVVPAFVAWQALHFDEEERADDTLAGPAASAAGDGMPNLVKFALGLAPGDTPPADAAPRLSRDIAGSLTLELRRAIASGVLVTVESSGDLQTWTPLAVEPAITPDAEPGHEWLSFALPASSPKAFYRPRFTLP